MRIFLLTIIFSFLYLVSFAQNHFDFVVKDQALTKALQQLSSQSQTPIAFSSRIFDASQRVSLSLQHMTVEEILQQILQGSGVSFSPKGKGFVLKKIELPQAIISGYVSDGESGERLIQAAVFIPSLSIGVLSNEYGFFSLKVPQGKHELKVVYTGYSSQSISLETRRNEQISFQLYPNLNLEEVLITTNREGEWKSGFRKMGVHRINPVSLSLAPNLLGENDLIQQVNMLPGVQTSADGFGGLHVRGGDQSQNLIMLDGVPVYNPSHLMGLFSIFNSQAIRAASLYSGGFSSRFGGRLSSILDVHTREGNLKKWSSEVGLGLISGNILIEGPIKKEQAAILLSGRSTLFTYFLEAPIDKLFPGNDNTGGPNFGFYDTNTKINYTLSPDDRLYFSYYRGKDRLERKFKDGMTSSSKKEEERSLNWGNQIFSARWNHLYNANLFSNLTLSYSLYDFQRVEYSYFEEPNEEEEEEDDEGESEDLFFQDIQTEIKDIAASLDFSYYPSQNNRWQFGGGISKHRMIPQFSTIQTGDEILESLELPELDELKSLSNRLVFDAWEGNTYAEYTHQSSSPISFQIGGRFSFFTTKEQAFFFPEPRIQFQYGLGQKWQIQVGLHRMVQYLHQIGTDLGMPSDVWIPSGEGIEPQRAWQEELGVHYRDSHWKFHINAYLKHMDHLYFFSDELGLIDFDEALDKEVQEGSGNIKGIELSLERHSGKTQGFLHYTLSKSERNFSSLNLGKTFPYLYDNRHRLSFFLIHPLSPTLSLSLNWNYASGLPQFIVVEHEILQSLSLADPNPPGLRNTLRNRPIHRLDLGLNYSFETEWIKHSLQVGVYNAYNRNNTSFFRSVNRSLLNPEEITLLPLMPSFRYILSF